MPAVADCWRGDRLGIAGEVKERQPGSNAWCHLRKHGSKNMARPASKGASLGRGGERGDVNLDWEVEVYSVPARSYYLATSVCWCRKAFRRH